MENPNLYDVIVVGAGVMGSSTGYQSAKKGHKTLILEQFDFLHFRGSSHGESRTIRATYPESYYWPMVIEAEKLWREVEEEVGYNVYFKSRQLDMGPVDNTSVIAMIENCEKQLVNYRVYDCRKMKEEFCGLVEIPENWTAVVTEIGGVLKPTKAVAMFQALAVKHGAVLKDKTEIVDIEIDEKRGGVVVKSKSGEKFWGKKCVVTAGTWVSKLVNKVSNGGVVLPIQAVETSVYYWKIKNGYEDCFSIKGGFSSFASYGEPYIYGTPALEFPDLIKVAVHGGRECDPDKRTWGDEDTEGKMIVIGHLKEWIKLTFGERVDYENGPVISQSCLYSMTPDEDYIIDFLGGGFKEDVVIAGGFSGHGFKMAPVIGRILVDLATGGKSAAQRLDEEIKWFKMGRFEENPKGNIKGFDDQVHCSR